MVHARTIDTARGPAPYLETGSGWPVVLIHAFPLGAEMWRPQLEQAPKGFWFVAPDLRGLGRSPAGPKQPTMDDYAADIEALLNALKIAAAVIGGLSMGGYVTFALHRRAPERFTGIVLADTRAEADTADGRAARQTMSELVRSKGAGAVADAMLPKLLSATSRQDPAKVALVRGMIEANSVEGIDHAIHAMMNRPDSSPHLAKVSVPALVMVGEQDELTPRVNSERLQQGIERSQLVIVPGGAHLSNLDAPGLFLAALTNFLASSM